MKRVLVVDDSAFARKLIKDILNASDELTVVDTASNGRDALLKLETVRPDVVTLDVEMPIMNGIETLARIMAERPTPVVMLSSLTTEGAGISMSALDLGAVEVVAKPMAYGLPRLKEISSEIVAKVRAAADVDATKLCCPQERIVRSAVRRLPRRAGTILPIVVIASSTGGPRALRFLVPRLVSEVSAFYLIVQHFPAGFTEALARDLDNLSPLSIREAAPGDSPNPDTVLLAPSCLHCAFGRNGRISLTEDPPLWGVRPAADVSMTTAAAVFQSRTIGVVLTGMGRDGANGLSVIKANGGATLAEHESSCIIYGMPKVAIESGAADRAVPLSAMPGAIASVLDDVARKSA